MSSHHYLLAAVGHVDHGKSALVQAMTGATAPGSGEKSRMEAGEVVFARLEIAVPITDRAPATTLSASLADVPGHAAFVKNVIASAGMLDGAILIVAADDGWQAQTGEHLQILAYLGVTRLVVAVTKIDLAPDRGEATSAAAREKLAGTPFAGAPIIPFSIVTQAGVADLRSALTRMLADVPPPRDTGKPRLPVDRVFVLKGAGTVVNGTLMGGAFKRGQAVVLQPIGRVARIKNLRVYSKDAEAAEPGARVALNLPELLPGEEGKPETAEAQRGDVVTVAGLGRANDTLDVLIERAAPLPGEAEAETTSLEDGVAVRVHLGTGNFPARLQWLETRALAPGERALAQLRAGEAVFAFIGDRFVIRDEAQQTTLAGGVVLDPNAHCKHFRNPARIAFLNARLAALGDATGLVQTQLSKDTAARREGLLAKSNLSTAEVTRALDELIERGTAAPEGDWVLDMAKWGELCQAAAKVIDAEHAARPERPGLSLAALRTELADLLPATELFEALIGDLARAGFVLAGAIIRRVDHQPAMPPNLQAAAASLRATLATRPLDPPGRRELAPDMPRQQALRFLIETNVFTALGDDIVLLTENYQSAAEAVRKHLRAKGSATTGELRQAIGTNRRVIIPLLELLDREGITERNGDKRALTSQANAR